MCERLFLRHVITAKLVFVYWESSHDIFTSKSCMLISSVASEDVGRHVGCRLGKIKIREIESRHRWILLPQESDKRTDRILSVSLTTTMSVLIMDVRK